MCIIHQAFGIVCRSKLRAAFVERLSKVSGKASAAESVLLFQEKVFGFIRLLLGFLSSTCRYSVEVHIRGHISTGSRTIPRLQGDGGRVQVAQQV